MKDINYQVEFDSIDRGFCIWLTGLPCSGKTTVANALRKFFENLGKKATVIDGDALRRFLSDHDFSKEGRLRVNLIAGYVAGEIVKHKGIVVCALVSPYKEIRDKVRSFFENNEFILVYLNTPIEVCIKRDTKGMYKKAIGNQIENFTGIGDVYEPPDDADLVIDTSTQSINTIVERIISYTISKLKKNEEKTNSTVNTEKGRKIFSAEEVVTQFYRGFFNREPDIEGFNHYVSHIRSGKFAISDLIKVFLESEEFKLKSFGSGLIDVEKLIEEIYLGLLNLLNRMPDLDAKKHIKNHLISGGSTYDVIKGITRSEEFFMKQHDVVHHMLPHKDHIAFAWDKPAIVFIHVPKTAGQSLHYLFRQKFGEDKVSPLFNNLYLLPVIFAYSYDVIFGHTDYDTVNLVVQRKETKIITFLRDPVKRLISLYRFWWSHDPEFHRGNMAVELANKYTIQEFFKAEEVKELLWNDMFRRFIGYKTSQAIKDEWFTQKDKTQRKKFIENEIVPLIRAQIDKYFYIGLQENFVRDVCKMFNKLGYICLESEIRNVRINVTEDNIRREGFKKEKPEFPITDTIINAIKDLTVLDSVLYNEVIKMKMRDKDKNGGSVS